ncbi:MAG: hypothetical protein AB7I79_05130 [Rhizobiaceae bacterium]
MQSYDRSQRLKYLYARETAARLIANPALVERAREYLTTKIAPNPRLRSYYVLWRALIERPADEIAERLLADTAEGEKLRDSMPVFDTIEGADRDRLLRQSRDA